MEIITALLGFISAYFVFRQNDKVNQLKYITEERQKWREKIRRLSVSFMTGKIDDGKIQPLEIDELKNIREQVAVRLNPSDDEDKNILCLMDSFIQNNCEPTRNKIREQLSRAFAQLLKHDWERVKNEAKMESNSTKFLLFLTSLFIVSVLFNCIGVLKRETCIFVSKHSESIFCFSMIWIIFFLLTTIFLYELFKYLRWRRKYRFENDLDYCCNKSSKNERKKCLHKYLGYVEKRK